MWTIAVSLLVGYGNGRYLVDDTIISIRSVLHRTMTGLVVRTGKIRKLTQFKGQRLRYKKKEQVFGVNVEVRRTRMVTGRMKSAHMLYHFTLIYLPNKHDGPAHDDVVVVAIHELYDSMYFTHSASGLKLPSSGNSLFIITARCQAE